VVETDGDPMPVGVRARAFRFGSLARVVSPNSMPAIQVSTGASYWRVQQLEVTADTAVKSMTVLVNVGYGGAPQTTLADVPREIMLDRMYIHGHASLDLRRCVALHGAWAGVANSHLSDCHSNQGDAQAVASWNGPGPFRLYNNYLEGSGENVMFGGATPSIPNLVPSDIRIEKNWFYKPAAWKGVWMTKNLFELKSAQRVLVEGNIFDGCWVDAQSCFALLLKSSNPGGAAWTVVQDVIVRYNRIRNGIGGVALAGAPDGPAVPAGRIKIEHNLFANIGSYNGTSYGRMFMLLAPLHDVYVTHNTAIPNVSDGAALVFDGLTGMTNTNLVIDDNVLVKGATGYGMMGGGFGQGITGLDRWGSPYSFRGNVLVAFPISLYPAGNYGPASMTDVGFVNVAGGDFRIASTSPYFGRASDGTNSGADIDKVTTYTSYVDLR
jgi:hypothetical protein